MNALRTSVASLAAVSLFHCATPSSTLVVAEEKRRETPTEYADKSNALMRDQEKEKAELERQQRVERSGLAKDYSVEVANDNLRVSDAKAKLYAEYVKFLADSNARISSLKLRVEAVQRRDGTKGREKLAEANRSIALAQTRLDEATERTTLEWDNYKLGQGKAFDAAEKAVSDAERAVAMR